MRLALKMIEFPFYCLFVLTIATICAVAEFYRLITKGVYLFFQDEETLTRIEAEGLY